MILLDTHALVWYLDNPTLLSAPARTSIDTALPLGGQFYSQISLWEIAMLEKKGRIQFRVPVADWLAKLESLPMVHGIGITSRIAAASASLPRSFPTDPADRIIGATARHLHYPLITKDGPIRRSGVLQTIW